VGHGNQRQKTFRGDNEYKAYLDRLEHYRAKFHLGIYAYCLMPDQVRMPLESGFDPLGKFMQGLQQSYTLNFNLRYRKVGMPTQLVYPGQLSGGKEAKFDIQKFNRIGPPDRNPTILFIRADTPYKSMDDVIKAKSHQNVEAQEETAPVSSSRWRI
jgi:hypothetical protein